MESRVLICTVCGLKSEDSTDKKLVTCQACGNHYLASDGIYLSQKTLKEIDKLKNLRVRLNQSVEINDHKMIFSHSDEILKILPDDFLAQYYFSYSSYMLNQPKVLDNFFSGTYLSQPKEHLDEIIYHLINYIPVKEYQDVIEFININNSSKVNHAEKILNERIKTEEQYSVVYRDVFICYRSTDTERAIEVANILENEGYSCWYAKRNLRPDDNENYWENIEEAIEKCKVFLILSSKSAMLSQDVQKEVQLADKKRKIKIQYKLDTTEPTVFFKQSFDGNKWILAYEDNDYDTLKKRVYDCVKNVNEPFFDYNALLKKAEILRKDKKFAEAIEVYQKVLNEEPDSIDANWGYIMAEYGVEYIHEGGRSYPTLHRPIQNYKITEEYHAKKLLQIVHKDNYEDFFEKINELENTRIKIEEETTKNKYDIFISCKITRNNTDLEIKTEDYEWANHVYRNLTQKGLKVFFSPISLASSNGSYEPIIYSALQSSKYLILLASKIEYLESTWIKNEWERFLTLKKVSSSKKYVKLVINDEVSRFVPSVLKQEGQYIKFDTNYVWYRNLEKAVLEIFPGYKNIQYNALKNPIKAVNLKLITRYKKQNLEKFKKIRYQEIDNQDRKAHEVIYKNLIENYESDHNVIECKKRVEIFLKNKQFENASIEINNYSKFAGGSLNYEIEMLKILVNTKSKSLDDFYENNLSRLSSIDSLKKVIKNSDFNSFNIYIKPLIKYVEKNIKEEKKELTFEIYKTISKINNPLIKKMHVYVSRNLGLLIQNKVLMMQYYNIAYPYLSDYDMDMYIRVFSEFSEMLCKNNLFKEALVVTSNLLDVDSKIFKTLIMRLMIEFRSSDYKSLFSSIEEKQAYVKIENLLKSDLVIGVDRFAVLIAKHAIELIDTKKFDSASSWLEIIARIDFEESKAIFNKILKKCYELEHSYDVFDIALRVSHEEDLDTFINLGIKYIKYCLENGDFIYAKKLAYEISNYDTKNLEILNLLLSAELKTRSLLDPRIEIVNLKDLTILEKILTLKSSEIDQNDLLIKLMNLCISYIINEKITSNDYLFELFDKILTYFQNLEENVRVKNLIYQFAHQCLENQIFDKAMWYFITLVRLDVNYYKAYWGILKVKLKCIKDEELLNIEIPLDKYSEYHLSVKYSYENPNKTKYFSEILKNQIKNIKIKRKKSFKRGITKILFVSLCLFLIYLLMMS